MKEIGQNKRAEKCHERYSMLLSGSLYTQRHDEKGERIKKGTKIRINFIEFFIVAFADDLTFFVISVMRYWLLALCTHC